MVAAAAALLAIAPPAPAGAHPHAVPSTIRVALTLGRETVAVRPAEGAAVDVPGQLSLRADGSTTVVVGDSLRYLAVPKASVPADAQSLGVVGPLSEANGDLVLVGPYSDPTAAVRHRRRLRSALGAAPRVVALERGARVGPWAAAASTLQVHITPQAPDDVSFVDGRPYRGGFQLTVGDGGLSLINEVGFDDYLASVVGAEMPAVWELEALKAQAVAARNYALRRLDAGAAYDICDNQNCQAYGGAGTEHDRTRLAVDATTGVVALYDGELIEALYSANAGDFTASAKSVWGTEVPYLVEVPSPLDREALTVGWGAAGYRWAREVALDELAGYTALQGAGLGTVTGFRVTESSAAGRPTRLEVLGERGKMELVGDQIRTAFGLPSAFVTVSMVDPDALELINPTARRQLELRADGFRVESARRSVAFDAAPPEIRLTNGAVRVVRFRTPARVVFNGRGFGHGVGMSQWGAQGMARSGRTYEEILSHYYPGLELETFGFG